MGKQLGVIQYSGKLGQVVGMKKANGQRYNNVRERVTPSNPQSNAQADQRMKMNVANMMYRAIEPVLSRSWQNKTYGQESRNFFMSQVLKSGLETEGGWLPFIEKGVYNPVPAEVPVSVGSIGIDTTMQFTPDGWATTLILGTDETSAAAIIQAGQEAGLENGDQITMVACFDTGILQGDFPSNLYLWRYDSVIFNTEATTADELLTGVRGLLKIGSFASGQYSSNGMSISDVTNSSPSAAAIIISREKAPDAGKAGLRTTSKMFVHDSVKEEWGTAKQYERARRSYQKVSTAESDWEVDAESGGGTGGRETVDSTYTLTTNDLVAAGSGAMTPAVREALIGKQIKVKKYNDDDSLAAVYYTTEDEETVAVKPDGTALSVTIEMVEHFCKLSWFDGALAQARPIPV